MGSFAGFVFLCLMVSVAIQIKFEVVYDDRITKFEQFESQGHLYRCTYSENDKAFQEGKRLISHAETHMKKAIGSTK